MRLKEGDDVVGVVVAAEKDIFTISADGNAKRNAASAYRLQGRNGQGTINFKKGYEVVALVAADDRDELVGISNRESPSVFLPTRFPARKQKEDRASSSSVWKRETGLLPSMWFPNRKKMKKIHN